MKNILLLVLSNINTFFAVILQNYSNISFFFLLHCCDTVSYVQLIICAQVFVVQINLILYCRWRKWEENFKQKEMQSATRGQL